MSVGMTKFLLSVVFSTIFLSVAVAKPKFVTGELDGFKRLVHVAPDSTNALGYVVIDSVTNRRVQPYTSGKTISIEPFNQNTQIGIAQVPYSTRAGTKDYAVLLDSNINDLVLEIVTLGFNSAGYAVVPADDERASSAHHVAVEIASLWTWLLPHSDEDYQFNFDMAIVVHADGTPFSSIGKVQSMAAINGSHPKMWRSYNNTATPMVKDFLNNFMNAVHRSVFEHEKSGQ
jgi:hypothetical protein